MPICQSVLIWGVLTRDFYWRSQQSWTVSISRPGNESHLTQSGRRKQPDGSKRSACFGRTTEAAPTSSIGPMSWQGIWRRPRVAGQCAANTWNIHHGGHLAIPHIKARFLIAVLGFEDWNWLTWRHCSAAARTTVCYNYLSDVISSQVIHRIHIPVLDFVVHMYPFVIGWRC